MGSIGFVLIEGGMIFGGMLAFCLWQLRVLKRDRAELERKKAEAATKASEASETATSA